MYEKDFFDRARITWRRLTDFLYWDVLVRVQIWWRPVAIVLGLALLLVAVVFGAYKLAVASPVVKLSMTLGALLAYHLTSEISKRVPHDPKGKFGQFLGLTVLVMVLIEIYGLILSAFIVWWPVTLAIVAGFVLAIELVLMETKKISIPIQLIWIKNGVTIFTYAALIYYLAHYLGLL